MINNKFKKTAVGGEMEKRKSSILVSKLSNQTFFVLVFIEFAVLILLGYFFFIKNLYQELEVVKNDLLPTRQLEYEKINKQYTEFLSINDSFKALKLSSVEKAKLVLPEKANLPDILTILDSIVSNNGFEIKSIFINIFNEDGEIILPIKELNNFNSPRANILDPDLIKDAVLDIKEKEKLKIIEFDLKITGSGYSSFKKLMAMTEKSLRLFDVVGFSFSSIEPDSNVKLRAYYL